MRERLLLKHSDFKTMAFLGPIPGITYFGWPRRINDVERDRGLEGVQQGLDV